MHELKKIDVWSAAKLQAVLMAIMGFIIGIFFALMGIFVGAIERSIGVGFAFGAFGIILLPIMYGAMGLVFGALSAFLYNLVAGWIGGIKIDLK